MKKEIEGYTLKNIEVIHSTIQNALYEKILIYFDDFTLEVKVNNSTDELKLSFKQNSFKHTNAIKPEWSSKVVGKQVVSYWLCKNHKKYFDCFCIGLDEFVPSIIMTSIASHIDVRFSR